MAHRGHKEHDKYKAGGTLTCRQAIFAKCFDCTCHYADGRADCECPQCPLYGYMPYGEAYKNRKKTVRSANPEMTKNRQEHMKKVQATRKAKGEK